MKFTTLLRSLLVTVLAIPMAGQAHYFRSSKLSNNALFNTQEIITWGDYHHSGTPENKAMIVKQTEDILAYAKALNAAIIVEDGVTFKDGQEFNAEAGLVPPILPVEKLESMPPSTPIHGIASYCHYQNIPCTNVEFRFTNHRPLNVYCKLIENKKKQLLSYDDGEAFNTYYRKKLAELEQSIEIPCQEFFKRAATSNLTINQFCARTNIPVIPTIDNVLEKIYFDEKLPLADMTQAQKISSIFNGYTCAFIDLDILHAIAQYKDHKTIFICAGDFHIECIKKALIEIGYYHQASSGADSIERKNHQYVEPTAIDVEQVLDGLQHVPSYPISQIIIALCAVMVILGCAVAIKTLKPILL